MRGSSEGTADTSSFLTITILIERQQSYQFMLRCGGNASIATVLASLQKAYDAAIKGRPIFRDQECTAPVRPEERALATPSLFLAISYQEYQAIVKTLFFAKPEQPNKANHELSPHKQKKPEEQLSTAPAKNEIKYPQKDVSKFEVAELPVGKQGRVVYPQTAVMQAPPRKASKGHLQNQENNIKTNPEAFELTRQDLLVTDNVQRSQPASSDCCALI